MRTSATLGDQFVAHAPREWKIGDAVAVEMAELTAPEPELDAPEPVRRRLHAWPRLHEGGYLFTCVHGYAQ